MKTYTAITDPGVDDIVALGLLRKLTPTISHCLISTFGNAPEEYTSKNAGEFITYCANTWQLLRGSKTPLSGKVEHPWPDYFHGPDGIWNTHPTSPLGNPTIITETPKNESVISLGPMTDTLKLIRTHKPKELAIMGGAFNEKGNETEYAEFNIALDPDAANTFFEECKNIDVKIVPLDVTRKAKWPLDAIKAIPEDDKTNKWIKEILLAWYKNYNHEKEADFNLHDPLAIFLTFFPEYAIWKTSGVGVVTEGKESGRTIFKNGNPPCHVAVNLTNPKEISEKIYDLLFTT